MAKISQAELRRLAVVGARARLQELRAEIAELTAAFPELGARSAVKPGNAGPQESAPSRRRRRGRKGMSAEQRNAVSERMKKYWAERRSVKK